MGHDTGACLFQDDRLIFSIETERLTRVKHDASVGVALDHLFATAGVKPADVTNVVFSTNVRNSVAKIRDFVTIEHRIACGGTLHAESECELLGRPVPCVVVAHEASHAALACHSGGWRDRGLVLVNEGHGTFSRNTCFTFKSSKLTLVDRDGLPWYGTGFGWSITAHLLGFGDAPSAAGTIMALGAYGEPDAQTRDVFNATPRNLHLMDRQSSGDSRRCAPRGTLAAQTSFEAEPIVVSTLQNVFTGEPSARRLG